MGLYEELLALTESELIRTHDAQRSRLDSAALGDEADPDVIMEAKLTGVYAAFGCLALRLTELALADGESDQVANGILIGSLLTSWILIDVAEQQKLANLVARQTDNIDR